MSTKFQYFFRRFQHFHNFYFVFLCNMHLTFSKTPHLFLFFSHSTVPHFSLFHAFLFHMFHFSVFHYFFDNCNCFRNNFMHEKETPFLFRSNVSDICSSSVLLHSRKIIQNSVLPCFVIFRYFPLFGRSHPQSVPFPQSSFRQSCG